MNIHIKPEDINNPNFANLHESNIDKAILATPLNSELYMLKGICAIHRGDYNEALDYALQGIGLEPYKASNYITLASVYYLLENYVAEGESYEKGYSISKTCASLNWNYSHYLLRTGQFKFGYDLYRWRKVHLNGHRRFLTPDLASTKPYNYFYKDIISTRKQSGIIVWAEQGLGDIVMSLSYLPMLENFYTEVIVEVPEQLYNLVYINKNKLGVSKVVLKTSDGSFPFDIEHYDNVSLMDLPYFFHKEIPIFMGDSLYTPTDVDNTWLALLNEIKDKKIGINWRGSSVHPNDKNRSANINIFEPLSKVGSLISLDLEEPPKTDFEVYNACGGFVSAEYTASLISQLDYVVTVDSFIAHLAGSLGVKTCLLLPYQNEWRWLDGKKQTWYQSVDLFKQEIKGDWNIPIENVVKYIKNDI